MTDFKLKNVATVVASFAAAMCFSAAIFGCGKKTEEPEPEPQPAGRIAVNLNAGILPTSVPQIGIVRSVVNDQFEETDRVGLYMKRAGMALNAPDARFSEANNRQKSIVNGVLVSSPQLMYPLDGNVDFIAYYPFSSMISNFSIPVNVANQTNGLPVEVLYSDNVRNQEPTASAVTLNFKYSLAKIEVTVVGNSLSAENFDALTVTAEGLYTQATLQFTDGSLNNLQGKQPVTMYKKSSSAASATFEMLALPSNEDVTFHFNMENAVISHEMTANYSAATTYRFVFSLELPPAPEPKATLLNAYIVPRDEEPVQYISVEKPNDAKFTIVAEVENGNSYNNLIDSVVAYGWVEEEDDEVELASGIYANGGFTMTLPTPPDSKFLESILYSGLGSSYSDVNAKLCIIHKSSFEGYSSSGANVGYFFHGSYNDPSTWVIYTYSDRDVTITGSNVSNVSLKKGWNILYVLCDDDDDICMVSTDMPSVFVGMKWKFFD